jgi:hypothetical protein
MPSKNDNLTPNGALPSRKSAYFALSAFPLSQLRVQDVSITMESQETKERLQRGEK